MNTVIYPNRPFFILGSEAWGNKTKQIYYSLLSLKMISFVLFPEASQPSMNFNISELVYWHHKQNELDSLDPSSLRPVTGIFGSFFYYINS